MPLNLVCICYFICFCPAFAAFHGGIRYAIPPYNNAHEDKILFLINAVDYKVKKNDVNQLTIYRHFPVDNQK